MCILARSVIDLFLLFRFGHAKSYKNVSKKCCNGKLSIDVCLESKADCMIVELTACISCH